MAERPYVVVGAGLAGLAAAEALSVRAPVQLVERLPASGGMWGYEHPLVRELTRRCERAGVQFRLGMTALRWVEGRLLIIGPGIRTWLEAEKIVFAGGTRPAIPAELPLTGGRLAGVFQATVAHHLLDAHIDLGRQVVVHGLGDWAELVVPDLLERCNVTIVGGHHSDSVPWPGVRWWPSYRPVRAHGVGRIEKVTVDRGRLQHDLPCDALILAADPRPIRNIDGAIRDSDDVTFVQALQLGLGPDAVVDHAIAAVARLASTKELHHDHQFPRRTLPLHRNACLDS